MRDLDDVPWLLLVGELCVRLGFFEFEAGTCEEPWNGQVTVHGVAEEVAEMEIFPFGSEDVAFVEHFTRDCRFLQNFAVGVFDPEFVGREVPAVD